MCVWGNVVCRNIPLQWLHLAHETLVGGPKDALVVLDQHLGDHIHSTDIEVDLIRGQQAGTPHDGQVRGRHAIRGRRRSNTGRKR